jgi:hypothetical protein
MLLSLVCAGRLYTEIRLRHSGIHYQRSCTHHDPHLRHRHAWSFDCTCVDFHRRIAFILARMQRSVSFQGWLLRPNTMTRLKQQASGEASAAWAPGSTDMQSMLPMTQILGHRGLLLQVYLLVTRLPHGWTDAFVARRDWSACVSLLWCILKAATSTTP